MEFERVFGNDWDAGQAIMRDSGSFVKSFRLRKGNERLAILCADFTLEDKTHAQEDGDSAYTAAFGYLGRGKVYEDRIQGLVDETKRLLKEFESIAIAWAVHFPPEYPDPDSDLKLLDEHLLLYEAVALKVKVIFAGHTHQEAHYQYAPRRNVNVFCAGTSTSTDTLDKNSVHEITLPVDGGKIDVPGIHHKSIAFEIL